MIFVDPLMQHGWRMRGRVIPSCHLICDGDLSELHRFAQRIGLKRQWFQPVSIPHYDLTENRRRDAVAAGAVELDRRQAAHWIRLWKFWMRTP